MACRGCPASESILSQATARWPDRYKASDGICASQSHTSQNPTSDHEGDSSGQAHATDLGHDPAYGPNGHLWVESLTQLRYRCIKYIIFSGRMWRAYGKPGVPAWTPQKYTGPNSHAHHVHVSVYKEYEDDTPDWFAGMPNVPGGGSGPVSPPVWLDDEEEHMQLTTAGQRMVVALKTLKGRLVVAAGDKLAKVDIVVGFKKPDGTVVFDYISPSPRTGEPVQNDQLVKTFSQFAEYAQVELKDGGPVDVIAVYG